MVGKGGESDRFHVMVQKEKAGDCPTEWAEF
jgi:hypothetical protein